MPRASGAGRYTIMVVDVTRQTNSGAIRMHYMLFTMQANERKSVASGDIVDIPSGAG